MLSILPILVLPIEYWYKAFLFLAGIAGLRLTLKGNIVQALPGRSFLAAPD